MVFSILFHYFVKHNISRECVLNVKYLIRFIYNLLKHSPRMSKIHDSAMNQQPYVTVTLVIRGSYFAEE